MAKGSDSNAQLITDRIAQGSSDNSIKLNSGKCNNNNNYNIEGKITECSLAKTEGIFP